MLMHSLLAVAALAGASLPVVAQEWPLPIATLAERRVIPQGGTPVQVTLRFDGLVTEPVQVIRLSRAAGARAWRLADIRRANNAPGAVTAVGQSGVESLLLVQSSRTGMYLLDGPFRWPAEPSVYVIPAQWRRTVRGRASGGHASVLTWLTAAENDGRRDSWPACSWTSEAEWECVGVHARAAGAVAARAEHPWFAAAPGTTTTGGVETVSAVSAAWGRLLVTSTPAGTRVGGIAAVAQRLVISPRRPQAIRSEVETDSRVRIVKVGTRGFLVYADGAADEGWVEVKGSGVAPARVEVKELATGSPDIPFLLALDPPVSLEGHVTAAGGAETSGTVVALYRLGAERRDGPRTERQRIAVAETRAGEDGGFRFDDLALEPYDLVALHPVLGRAERQVTPDGREVALPLQPSAKAIGRVVRDGAPLARVPVRVVPDLGQFAAAVDVTALRGGEAVTDDDGRFVVALAPGGGGEIRIGEEPSGVRRIPAPTAESLRPVVDLGTIELSGSRVVLAAIDGAEGCELLFTGPAGRAGMTIARAMRIGPAMFKVELPESGRWTVVGTCAGRERAVVPGSVEVPAGVGDFTVRLAWVAAPVP